MSDWVIEAEGLCAQAGRRYLLKDINWQVKRGEHWVVFGMNGSGKTTLLSIIAGFRQYTAGELRIFGEPFTNAAILKQRQRIGFVSSSFFDRYFKHETAMEIVLSAQSGAFGLSPQITDQVVRRARELLTALQLADKSQLPYHFLSKGERQRVLIARALLTKPELLVLDEPCSGLDILAREQLQQAISQLAGQTETTLIYVTHYTEEILPVMHQALLLSHGRLWAMGAVEELFTAEKLSAFLGYPIAVRSEDQRYLPDFGACGAAQAYQLWGGDAT